MKKLLQLLLCILLAQAANAQGNWDALIEEVLPATLKKHREFVSLPNVASNEADMMENVAWAQKEFEQQGFSVRLLESSTLPVFLAERSVNPNAKTILFYFHLDGQAVNPENWDQPDPFVPVLKAQSEAGGWKTIDWNKLDGKIDPDWRIYGRAAADDKAPIMMMLTALELLEKEGVAQNYNLKIILDLQEEAGSDAFLSTLEKYKTEYAADYMIIMDGPAHNTNKPTLTFGCRGNARCSITTYGSKLPQHSGHYGNYSPNPIFTLSHLLASMKDENGKVTIDGYYDGIEISPEVNKALKAVPDKESDILAGLLIKEADQVASTYQEALQYPSLNVRHIETSWKGPGLKTIIPEYVTAHLDVRLVAETDGAAQIEKIKRHIQKEGYYLIDREPTDEERLQHAKIVTFIGSSGVNAFRTPMDDAFGKKLRSTLTNTFGEAPVSIRTMGGTVPIIPAINTLKIPAVIVPMVNMDNNQHNPNENIRIGNISQGIKICMAILSMEI